MRRALGMSAAVVLTLLMLLVAAGAREKKKQKPEDTIYGTIGCSVPPAPPAAGAPPNPADSIALCIARKGKAVIVQDGGQTATPIENPDAVGDYEGHRVSISGYMNGDSFHVVSLRII
jgi:hypothetical protein